jgi:hypothetical protein
MTLPRAWSDKRERQYEHIKESAEDRGYSQGRAKEIAARTINKDRAQEGEARRASKTSIQDMAPERRGGKRSGKREGPGGLTREQLYNEAKRRGIKGRSKMSKRDLQRVLGKS